MAQGQGGRDTLSNCLLNTLALSYRWAHLTALIREASPCGEWWLLYKLKTVHSAEDGSYRCSGPQKDTCTSPFPGDQEHKQLQMLTPKRNTCITPSPEIRNIRKKRQNILKVRGQEGLWQNGCGLDMQVLSQQLWLPAQGQANQHSEMERGRGFSRWQLLGGESMFFSSVACGRLPMTQ